MEENKQNPDDSSSLETLESTDTSVNSGSSNPQKPDTKSSFNPLGWIKARLNLYLILFLISILASIGITVYSLSKSSEDNPGTITTQELTPETLESLTNSDTTIGDPQQLLTIDSNAVFSGKVLVRGGLDVAGTIQVGGDLSLPGITVSGTSSLDQVQVNDLAINGDTNVQGTLTVANGLSVGGQATFNGTLSVNDLQLTGDLQLNSHIDAGGNTPRVSAGGAVGSGGTVTISGTDTAGTVTVNIGSGASGGNLATVTFANAFSGTPHVVITPIGNLSSGTQQIYLSNRTNTSFAIATSGGLSSGSISFDFVAID